MVQERSSLHQRADSENVGVCWGYVMIHSYLPDHNTRYVDICIYAVRNFDLSSKQKEKKKEKYFLVYMCFHNSFSCLVGGMHPPPNPPPLDPSLLETPDI